MATFQSQYIDDSSIFRWEIVGQYIYLGSAALGVVDTDTRWAIQRVDKTNGSILHADWSAEFIKKWTDRATYSYS